MSVFFVSQFLGFKFKLLRGCSNDDGITNLKKSKVDHGHYEDQAADDDDTILKTPPFLGSCTVTVLNQFALKEKHHV